ncbi:MAG: BrnT family toxin [Acidobacteria bacterium]|nr:BrnT family toxin [Acidobacteriota bacterium]
MFSWDARKALLNLKKHGVSFEEAATVFADPDALDWEDLEHSGAEARSKRLGRSVQWRVLIIVYTLRRFADGQETIGIIGARRASYKERKAYAGQPH